ncbi:MAG: mechanosensitive ion channel family protein, partial [Candidatus Hydrogenedentes bacterium]|nr:mechanosensitive ion channel family protein [Candidatus Hydrogenedentota bacterium]
ILSFAAQVAVWSLALLVALQNLGFEITALIAGLGIGGIAIAFALQNILGDIFCSVAIVLDKPFAVGDFIIVGDQMGVVENIGIKTTRVRSLWGEQIIFSNADLTSNRIRNYKRMKERRITFSLGVVYETPLEKLERIPTIIRDSIEAVPLTRFDRAHFNQYGDFSLNFEVVYYVLSPDYNTYMDIQQSINLAIFRRFKEEGIVFAYPTQELIIRPNEESSSTAPAMPREA